MSYRTMLDKTCDIYRMEESDKSSTYGIPSTDQEKSYTYPSIATYFSVPCYGKESNNETTNRLQVNDPGIIPLRIVKLYLPVDTDIQYRDRIYYEGQYFKVDTPRTIKGKIKYVRMELDEDQN